ncbi:orotidine-5'-phosphate decarboxylase [Microaerobacter geothermalis]|uniref:orotidine-5'-phosphate decarboxylase n=1 Tax=Microaerobacter geothermalis TaxID=674972 RepID=UPI001F1B1829|nr:orotidine-5'-phosphate decarboxylase [Microaerobacter geothermalis]MCF6094768.1 orotidine-5'-phosphate decarboxylase [Microaerobacter geothermalis]
MSESIRSSQRNLGDQDNIRHQIIVALDFPSYQEAINLAESLSGKVHYMKVGMQLFYSTGPRIIEKLKELGFRIFLDLKVHDIPNTAKGAIQSMANLGVDMVNVHVSGGKGMMEAAREGLEKANVSVKPLLIGVTQLTSTSQSVLNHEIGIPGSVEKTVERYAILAKEAGLDGVVSSPLEVKRVKQVCSSSFLTVTPGIRLPEGDKGDQHRITTPEEAFALGTDYIVIGRPVTRAADPAKAFEEIVVRCMSDL